MAAEKVNKGRLFCEFIIERLKKPIQHPEFIIYFIFVVLGIGAIDIWAALYLVFHHSNEVKDIVGESHPDYQHIQISIIGFSIVLICSGGIDLVFSTVKNIRRIIQLLAILLIIIGIVLFFLLFNNSSGFGFFVSVTFALVSLFVWWIANAENANLTGEDYVDEMSDETKRLGDTLKDLENA